MDFNILINSNKTQFNTNNYKIFVKKFGSIRESV